MVNGYAPTSLQEALELLTQEELTPYAGGTDLMIEDKREGEYLFLHKIAELKEIQDEGDTISIGAACTYTVLLNHELIPELLKEAVSLIAAPAIRNEGTIGGNIANGSAKADSALICAVTDSLIHVSSVRGSRTLTLAEFYKDNKQLDLIPDELIVRISMPKKWLDSYTYQKVGARKSLAISRVSFAGLLSIEDDTVQHCATAFGAVADRIIRPYEIDAFLVGKTVAEAQAAIQDYLSAYEKVLVLKDGRVSAEYRKDVCLNLLKDFLKPLCEPHTLRSHSHARVSE